MTKEKHHKKAFNITDLKIVLITSILYAIFVIIIVYFQIPVASFLIGPSKVTTALSFIINLAISIVVFALIFAIVRTLHLFLFKKQTKEK